MNGTQTLVDKDSSKSWIKCEPCPYKRFTNMVVTANGDILTVASDSNRSVICKYNTNLSQWTTVKEAKLDGGANNIAMDNDFNTICILFPYAVTKFDLNSNAAITYSNVGYLGPHSSSLVIHGIYHSLCGVNNNWHLIWNEQTKKFDKNHRFTEFNYNSYHGSVYVEKQKKILFFGGWNGKCLDEIFEYSLSDNQWKLLDIKLVKAVEMFGYTLSLDQKYIFIFGGYNSEWIRCRDIYIWDLQQMTILKSSIKCPTQNVYYHAVCVGNTDHKNQLLVYGYIRTSQYDLSFPVDIIKLIAMWCKQETIHLFAKEQQNEHWKIDVNQLLNICKDD